MKKLPIESYKMTKAISDLCEKIKVLETERDYYIEKSEFMKQKYNDLVDAVPHLIEFVVMDVNGGNDPCIYKRGKLWRYHTQRAGNQWHDHENPATAALLARIRS